jgi:hypothetical protein
VPAMAHRPSTAPMIAPAVACSMADASPVYDCAARTRQTIQRSARQRSPGSFPTGHCCRASFRLGRTGRGRHRGAGETEAFEPTRAHRHQPHTAPRGTLYNSASAVMFMRCLCAGLAAPERCLKESPSRQNTHQHPKRSLDFLVCHGNTLAPSGQVSWPSSDEIVPVSPLLPSLCATQRKDV